MKCNSSRISTQVKCSETSGSLITQRVRLIAGDSNLMMGGSLQLTCSLKLNAELSCLLHPWDSSLNLGLMPSQCQYQEIPSCLQLQEPLGIQSKICLKMQQVEPSTIRTLVQGVHQCSLCDLSLK